MAGMRALSFTRYPVGAAGELAGQRAVFAAACAARGWILGGSVCQIGGGLRAWWAVLRLVRSGGYGVVVVGTFDRIAVTETGRTAVLAMLRRAGVRLLIARDGIDTGDGVGAALVGSLLAGGMRTGPEYP